MEECDDEEEDDYETELQDSQTASANGTIVAPQAYDETNSTATWNETAAVNETSIANETSTESWSASETASSTESWSAEASATESWSAEASATESAAADAAITSYVEVYATSYVEPSAAEATPAADEAVTVDSADTYVRRAGRKLTKVVRRF